MNPWIAALHTVEVQVVLVPVSGVGQSAEATYRSRSDQLVGFSSASSSSSPHTRASAIIHLQTLCFRYLVASLLLSPSDG